MVAALVGRRAIVSRAALVSVVVLLAVPIPRALVVEEAGARVSWIWCGWQVG